MQGYQDTFRKIKVMNIYDNSDILWEMLKDINP